MTHLIPLPVTLIGGAGAADLVVVAEAARASRRKKLVLISLGDALYLARKHGKTMGKWWFNGALMEVNEDFMGI